jgi:hypothetical protein
VYVSLALERVACVEVGCLSLLEVLWMLGLSETALSVANPDCGCLVWLGFPTTEIPQQRCNKLRAACCLSSCDCMNALAWSRLLALCEMNDELCCNGACLLAVSHSKLGARDCL